jgi:hypothetical protein
MIFPPFCWHLCVSLIESVTFTFSLMARFLCSLLCRLVVV